MAMQPPVDEEPFTAEQMHEAVTEAYWCV